MKDERSTLKFSEFLKKDLKKTDLAEELEKEEGIPERQAESLPEDFELFRKLKELHLGGGESTPSDKDSADFDSYRTAERIRITELIVKKDGRDDLSGSNRLREKSDEGDGRERLAKADVEGMTSAEDRLGVDSTGMEKHEAIYQKAIEYLQSVRFEVKENRPFDIEPAVEIVRMIVDSPELLKRLYALTFKRDDAGSLESHQANVAIYALKVGIGMEYAKERLIELGLSAMHYDIGLFRIPEGILRKSGKLNEREAELVKTHVFIGRDILSSFQGRFPDLQEVACQHHERENGQGYPQGLRGHEINELAKIIGLLDSYEAMTHSRPYRKALGPSFSAKELLKTKHAAYSPNVIKAFLREISLYPVGSYVRLNNRAIAEVVETNQNHPLRPTVRILFDGEGNEVVDDVVIRLEHNPLFFIVEGLAKEELLPEVTANPDKGP